MIREPNFAIDGWCLVNGEERNKATQSIFQIPSVTAREGLKPGDLAKLIFRIQITDVEQMVATERMWVIVRECIPGAYLGVLDNDPNSLAKNKDFSSGIELPFSARHIIDICKGDENTKKIAAHIPERRWPRE